MTDNQIYISVILPLRLEWEPWYSVPAGDTDKIGEGTSSGTIAAGDRVRVLFAGKEYIGVVSGTCSEPGIDKARIRNILCVEKSLERIGTKEIRLWRQVAAYYMCTTGEVYKAAYPSHKVFSEEAIARRAERKAKRKSAILEAAARKLQMVKNRQEKVLKSLTDKKEALLSRVNRKAILLSESRTETARGKYIHDLERLKSEVNDTVSKISSTESEIRRIGAEIAGLQQDMTGDTEGPAVTADSPVHGNHFCRPGFSLSKEQAEALDSIRDSFLNHKTVLLKGVTGSGKTEIYMSLAEEVISRGKNVLYLVPEIALSKQLEDRLENMFGDRVMAFHSGETQIKRAEISAEIHSIVRKQARGGNESYLAVGTRSALFLPHENLGLIIVDEEHDSSYKQDSPSPKYNGRDTAVMLGMIHSCPVLLGSATPSLESVYNCMTGKYGLVELNSRYHGAPDAEIEIIDTSAERKKRGMKGSLSLKLIFRMEETLAKGEQIIILRSRRSYSPVLQCPECGFIPKCPHCNISLSYHKASGKDMCHFCGYSRIHTGRCPECEGQLSGMGAGTQKIEEELSSAFPQARIARLDSDSARNRKYEDDLIRRFSNGEIDILVGTQMVTKGFDFSGLTLVAVIGADSLLGQQDFRADEKALQTLEQFRGRCGRRGRKGTFIIQTNQPDHPVYRQLMYKDTISGDSLLKERRDFKYPPFCRIIDINIKDTYKERAERMSGILCAELDRNGFSSVGPYTGPSDKENGRYALDIRISLEKDSRLAQNKSLLKEIISDFEKGKGYSGHITLDVDPA